jgi:hypothetical protein
VTNTLLEIWPLQVDESVESIESSRLLRAAHGKRSGSPGMLFQQSGGLANPADRALVRWARSVHRNPTIHVLSQQVPASPGKPSACLAISLCNCAAAMSQGHAGALRL